MVRTETYNNLCHGTYKEAAEKIVIEGFKPSKAENSWCGAGVYFYDVKAKAWWSANRTCENVKAKTGIKPKAAVVFADIIDIPKNDVLDLRAPADVEKFHEAVSGLFDGETEFKIKEVSNEEERIIDLRSMLISFYAEQTNKKLVVGIFEQREQPLHQKAIEFATRLRLVLGAETIYCVRDASIIQNIRQGGSAV